jgi:hypothetical protein
MFHLENRSKYTGVSSSEMRYGGFGGDSQSSRYSGFGSNTVSANNNQSGNSNRSYTADSHPPASHIVSFTSVPPKVSKPEPAPVANLLDLDTDTEQWANFTSAPAVSHIPYANSKPDQADDEFGEFTSVAAPESNFVAKTQPTGPSLATLDLMNTFQTPKPFSPPSTNPSLPSSDFGAFMNAPTVKPASFDPLANLVSLDPIALGTNSKKTSAGPTLNSLKQNNF